VVYITQANLVSIVYDIPANDLARQGIMPYEKRILILSEAEKRRLLAVRQFLEAPECFVDKYYGAMRKRDDEDLVFPSSSPAYHCRGDCDRLRSEYTNYMIPEQITEKAKSDPSVVSHYRKWFAANLYLLDESDDRFRPEYFIVRLRSEFKIDVRDVRQIVRPNSGATQIGNVSIDELTAEIDAILKSAGQCFYESRKNEAILREFQKRAYWGYKEGPLPDNKTGYSDDEVKAFLRDYNEKFKKPLKGALITYYKMRYNPDLHFRGKLLDQVGFHPCSKCFAA